jgi:hypothetical protein
MTTILATVSTGSETTTQNVTVSPLSATSGTIVPTSPTGTIGASALALYNWNPATQLAGWLAAVAQVKAGVAGATAKIVALGDSTTRGYESAASDFTALSYPIELARALALDGVAAQYDNFRFLGEISGRFDGVFRRIILSASGRGSSASKHQSKLFFV